MSTRPTGAVSATGHRRSNERTNAQWYAVIVGAVLLLVGLLGFLVDSDFHMGHEASGTDLQGDGLFGFEVNGWHNLVHIASGLFLLAMSRKRRTAKTAVLAFGAIYGLVTIIGLIDGNDVLGIFPVNPADNVLHLVLSLAALAAGLTSRADDPLRRDDDIDSSRHGDGRLTGTGATGDKGRDLGTPTTTTRSEARR
jgi:hypothetical protein